jgi:hypothetical protein
MILLAPTALLAAALFAPANEPAAVPAMVPAPAAVPAAAFGPGVDAAMIPADARWLAHVDVQGMFNSTLFKTLQGLEPDLDFHNNPDVAELRQMLGFDPFAEVKSVTAYGLPRDEEAAVIMIRTSAAAESAFSLLEQHLDRRQTSMGGVDMQHWSEGHGDDMYTYMARKEGSDARLLLVAGHAHDLAMGVNALRGEIDSLADEPGLNTSAGPGVLAMVSASGRLAELGHDPEAERIAKMVESIQASLSENDGVLAVAVSVTAKNAADAMAARQMIQGGLAFVGLMARNEPEAAPILPLIDSLEVQTHGNTLSLRIERHVDDLVALIHELEGGGHGGWDSGHDDTDVYRAPSKAKKTNKDGWY